MSGAATAAVDFADIQGLARFGHGRLRAAEFLLLDIAEPEAARLAARRAADDGGAERRAAADRAADRADRRRAQRARRWGSRCRAVPQAFLAGMAGEASRFRRLGDVGDNDPGNWHWGRPVPHVLLMLCAVEGGLDARRTEVLGGTFDAGFGATRRLPTSLNRAWSPSVSSTGSASR